MNKVAFLELKYGNIYGGYPNFFVISDVSLLVFELDTNRIFLESLSLTPPVDIVFVNAKTNEMGHTVGRLKHVVNLKTRKKQIFREDFRLDEMEINDAIGRTKFSRGFIKKFFARNLRKYGVRDIVTFDGKRDLFLLEKVGVDFYNIRNFDLQKALNKKCNYLFSLNKLAVATGFQVSPTHVRSNNLEYFLHPIAARQIKPKTAAFDAARMFMAYQEFNEHQDDFMVKAQLLLNRIQVATAAAEEAAAAEAAAAAAAAPVVEETAAEAETPVVEEAATAEEVETPASEEAATAEEVEMPASEEAATTEETAAVEAESEAPADAEANTEKNNDV